MGPAGAVWPKAPPRAGVWRWDGGRGFDRGLPGDWYLRPADASPVAGAFLGEPVDSFPAGDAAHPASARAGGLDGAHGAARPAGRRPAGSGRAARPAGSRRVTVAVDGLWRWAFRGGSQRAELSHLGRGDGELAARWRGYRPRQRARRSARSSRMGGRYCSSGRAREPGTRCRWRGAEPDGRRARHPSIRRRRPGHGVARRRANIATGWRGGGGGTVAVEDVLGGATARTGDAAERTRPGPPPQASRRAARDWLWLFGLCVAALAGEWIARRRLGLR